MLLKAATKVMAVQMGSSRFIVPALKGVWTVDADSLISCRRGWLAAKARDAWRRGYGPKKRRFGGRFFAALRFV
jgi:hypothetical protein